LAATSVLLNGLQRAFQGTAFVTPAVALSVQKTAAQDFIRPDSSEVSGARQSVRRRVPIARRRLRLLCDCVWPKHVVRLAAIRVQQHFANLGIGEQWHRRSSHVGWWKGRDETGWLRPTSGAADNAFGVDDFDWRYWHVGFLLDDEKLL
jgi:hypothetical protein